MSDDRTLEGQVGAIANHGIGTPTSRSACFSTVTDSPVNMDSSALSVAASTSRKSAGTMLPSESSTTSPGTISLAGTMRGSPALRMRAVGAVMPRSTSSARSARHSCTTPMAAFSATMTTMMMLSFSSPTTPATMAAASSTRIMKSESWAAIINQIDRGGCSRTAFSPKALAPLRGFRVGRSHEFGRNRRLEASCTEIACQVVCAC